jgi:Tfp pilus assembly protein PilF
MANPRIDDLRRRVESDPASIAFAQLAEEYRRAGDFDQAITTARAGLDVHPGYLSARVTLARALLEVGQLEEAQSEFETVLRHAPDNLAAIRGLADLHHRQEIHPDTLAAFVREAAASDAAAAQIAAPPSSPAPPHAQPSDTSSRPAPPVASEVPVQAEPSVRLAAEAPPEDAEWVDLTDEASESSGNEGLLSVIEKPAEPSANPVLVALEQFLTAVHVSRPQQHP